MLLPLFSLMPLLIAITPLPYAMPPPLMFSMFRYAAVAFFISAAYCYAIISLLFATPYAADMPPPTLLIRHADAATIRFSLLLPPLRRCLRRRWPLIAITIVYARHIRHAADFFDAADAAIRYGYAACCRFDSLRYRRH